MNTDNEGRPWTSNAGATPTRRAEQSNSRRRHPLRRSSPTRHLPFLRAALASAREAEAVPGFLGGTVLADLWNRRFWTVSVWASPGAVRSYGSAPAHAKAMRRTQDWAAESQVERWRTSVRDSHARRDCQEVRRSGATARARAPTPTSTQSPHHRIHPPPGLTTASPSPFGETKFTTATTMRGTAMFATRSKDRTARPLMRAAAQSARDWPARRRRIHGASLRLGGWS